VINFAWGVDNAILGGVPNFVAHALGLDDQYSRCSTAYKVGSGVGQVARYVDGVGAARASAAGGGGAGIGNGSYEVLDGVRRAKAAAELGQETIAAEIQIGGKTVASGLVPVSSLLSPTKSAIDVSTSTGLQRWLSVLNGTRAGDALPSIIIQPGARGIPIPGVGFRF
jgi:hypothetical protein